MIEAVNSVVANASVLRGQAEQASVARAAANPERVQEVIQAPYVSPYISMDLNYNKAVLQIRDGDTGDVLKQFPSEAALELRSRQLAAKSSAPAFRIPEPEIDLPDVSVAPAPTPAPAAPAVNAQAQVAAAALASTAAQAAAALASTAQAAAAVSAPPTSRNVVVTA